MLKFGNTYLNYNGTYLKALDPLNPLDLPPFTIRLKYKEGVTPSFSKGMGVQVSQNPNVWDLTYENSDWNLMFIEDTDILEVLGANTTGITNMDGLFHTCTYLSSVPLFDTSEVTNMDTMFTFCTRLSTVPLYDTSNVTSMEQMFSYTPSLTSVPLLDTHDVINMQGFFLDSNNLKYIPLFDTSNVTNMNAAFQGCRNVESGALALYQQASSQANVPRHEHTFLVCGDNTQTGSAELAQIPWDWQY